MDSKGRRETEDRLALKSVFPGEKRDRRQWSCLLEGSNDKVMGILLSRTYAVGLMRNVETRLLTAPYGSDELSLNIMSVGGTMYLEEHLTEEKLRNK